MKNRFLLSYALGVIQLLILSIGIYLLMERSIEGKYILRAMKYHLWFEIGISILISYSLFHFIRTVKASAKMRKAAGLQKEVKSKRIQLLILFVMTGMVYYSLFYTVPMNKYIPGRLQSILYYTNSFLQFLLLISLIGSHESASEEFIKSKQKYAGVGAACGLALFYTYFQLIN